MIRVNIASIVLACVLVPGCGGEQSTEGQESATSGSQGRAQVHVPAADNGRTPTCSEFIGHMGALIDATGHPNPHFNVNMRPSAIAACERANNLEANATEARCVMRATDPEMLGDCGNGRFMQAW